MFASYSRLLADAGVTPAAVIIEAGPRWSPRRLASALRVRDDDSTQACRRLGWAYERMSGINAPAAIDAVRRLKPDLAVNAGAGILRRILDVPRIGTLGVHMGLLPAYRGVNVAEWAALSGDPVGCSVFWIDAGIDTGDIVATRAVDVSGCRSIDALRTRVNDAQLALLAEMTLAVLRGGAPAARTQRAADGRQYYRMHPELAAVLSRRLSQRDPS
jgi:methionyl-tRNA formyltransferase